MKNIRRILITYTRTAQILVISSIIFLSGCKKWADVETPPTSTSSENVYKENSGANSAFIGLYARLSQRYFNGGLQSVSLNTDLSADNLDMFDVNSGAFTSSAAYYQNSLEPKYTNEFETYWKVGYNILYTVNDAITKLEGNTDLSQKVATRLLGEAYFIRAFYYFYLVNLYGDVPLVLTTDPKANSKIIRTNSSDVYNQINSDLLKAAERLTIQYVGADVANPTTERLRPNLIAVYALQARAFLYERKYTDAEAAATKVITASGYTLAAPANVFIKNSSETIWGLQPVTLSINTYGGRYLYIPPTGPEGSEYNFPLSSSLISAFENGDQRRSDWVGDINVDEYHFAYKYKVHINPGSTEISEYEIVLRLAEQYLIRAEARNELGNTIDAVSDLNTLRAQRRAAPTKELKNPLPNLATTLSQAQLRPLILKERRVELFTEWGHRWFDLKRSGTIDNAMKAVAPHKGAIWSSYKAFYPVPFSDIFLNSAILQNSGYTN